MKLSIIILNWNAKYVLKEAIESVIKETAAFEYEIILVDNASTDGSVEMVREAFTSVNSAQGPGVIVIANKKNRGFAGGNNDGLAKAAGEYLMLLNPDTIVHDRAIEKLVQYLDAHDDVMMVGPKLLNRDGSFQAACRRNLPNPKNAFLHLFGLGKGEYKRTDDPDVSGPTEAISGAAMMVRRSVYETLGGLDEQFFMYAEDLDYCKRVADKGWQTYYLADARITHLGGESTKQRKTKSIKDFYGTMWLYYRKHFQTKNFFLLNWIVYIGIVVRCRIALLQNLFAKK